MAFLQTRNTYFAGKITHADAANAPDRDVPQGDGERILLVDDEPALTAALQRPLVRLKYQVTTSNDSGEAIRWFQNDPARFDLLITDLTMPEMTGLEMARQIHVLRPDLPIILASGFSVEIDREHLEAAGADELLENPYPEKTLAEVVQRIHAGHNIGTPDKSD